MKWCSCIITLVRAVDSAEIALTHLGGEVVRRDPNTNLIDVQFKTHKLRMTVNGISIRNTLTREYVRLPYEWIGSVDIR